jgi:hypothetical protein
MEKIIEPELRAKLEIATTVAFEIFKFANWQWEVPTKHKPLEHEIRETFESLTPDDGKMYGEDSDNAAGRLRVIRDELGTRFLIELD